LAKILKVVENMFQLPPEMKFEDMVRVLEYFGWTRKNVVGSHFTYYRKGHMPITIVKHKNKVKRGYIKKIIDELNLEDWYEKHKK